MFVMVNIFFGYASSPVNSLLTTHPARRPLSLSRMNDDILDGNKRLPRNGTQTFS